MELTDSALAEVVEGMSLVTRAEKHLDYLESRLAQCQVSIDPDSFKHIKFYLDKIHADLMPIPLAHAEAVAKKKRGRK